ncbi:tumor suppressor candidate 5 homolog [Lingula anatina]|uniref:Tumor suppressor candidate 5 homolog n=1 Tax=Lingula anatina TaxID=7574 RepID=A0A1S3HCF8_LINAN|nr:tumor suppressor candidate 5 homolog [Lingula anatina]XP_013383698.1 tumor suppressor candidate 5 homolog [Lingula anatina]|eukprot:XP_013383691.1 tumor suppressor candidate 5 homolog [Lingula anatina]
MNGSGHYPGPPAYGHQYAQNIQQGHQYPQPGKSDAHAQNTVVMAQPAASHTVVIQPPTSTPRPSSYLGLAIFVTICCNLPIGIIAIIVSLCSGCAADENNMDSARLRGKISMGLSITGIILTIGGAIAVILYFTVLVKAAVTTVGAVVG